MVSVKAAYIGNGIESFVENSFSTGMNVIYSLDNNRGKTILMQGIMFFYVRPSWIRHHAASPQCCGNGIGMPT